jgi:hypothetical protein
MSEGVSGRLGGRSGARREALENGLRVLANMVDSVS